MSYIRHLWFRYRLRREVRPAGYGVEVLYAGWVEVPAALRERSNRLP